MAEETKAAECKEIQGSNWRIVSAGSGAWTTAFVYVSTILLAFTLAYGHTLSSRGHSLLYSVQSQIEPDTHDRNAIVPGRSDFVVHERVHGRL